LSKLCRVGRNSSVCSGMVQWQNQNDLYLYNDVASFESVRTVVFIQFPAAPPNLTRKITLSRGERAGVSGKKTNQTTRADTSPLNSYQKIPVRCTRVPGNKSKSPSRVPARAKSIMLERATLGLSESKKHNEPFKPMKKMPKKP